MLAQGSYRLEKGLFYVSELKEPYLRVAIEPISLNRNDYVAEKVK